MSTWTVETCLSSFILALEFFEILSHLLTRLMVAAFLVEACVSWCTVQCTPVASGRLCDRIQRIDEQFAYAFALVVIGYRNILNVSSLAEVMDAFTCQCPYLQASR